MCNVSIDVWDRDMVSNEKPKKENGVNEMRMLRWMLCVIDAPVYQERDGERKTEKQIERLV